MSESFDEAVQRFQEFLAQNGRPRKVMWLAAGDITLSGSLVVYVRLPNLATGEEDARRAFELGMRQGTGVLIKGLWEIGDAMCSHIWAPCDAKEAELALMPRGAKLSIPGECVLMPKVVTNRAWWHYLHIRHRGKQELKDQVFE